MVASAVGVIAALAMSAIALVTGRPETPPVQPVVDTVALTTATDPVVTVSLRRLNSLDVAFRSDRLWCAVRH